MPASFISAEIEKVVLTQTVPRKMEYSGGFLHFVNSHSYYGYLPMYYLDILLSSSNVS